MEVHRIINNYQHSCTYILYENGCCYVWLVDCGSEVAKVIEWLHTNNKTIHGIFLTHCHDDHICGLKQLLKDNPKIPIYLSAHDGIRCVQDIRLNLTKYTLEPFKLTSDYFVELNDGDEVEIFSDVFLTAYQTDGHSLDSMVYKVDNHLFTGDAYIPPLKVVTKLPGADKLKAEESLKKILNLINSLKLTVEAGHALEGADLKNL